MRKWKNSDLEEVDDLQFAILVLSEKKAKLNPLAPLAVKLSNTIQTLEKLREENEISFPSSKNTMQLPLFCIDGTSGKKIDGICTVNPQSKEVIEVSLNDGSGALRQFEIMNARRKGEVPWNAMYLNLDGKLHSILVDPKNGKSHYI